MLGLSGANIVDVSCGEGHTLCVDSAGVLYSFGKGGAGQLGHGSTSDSLWPVRLEVTVDRDVYADDVMAPPTKQQVTVRFVKVSAGVSHSAVRRRSRAAALSCMACRHS